MAAHQSGLLSVEEALSRVLERVSALPTEPCSLALALGRVLAEDIIADVDNPPFDSSAVDGYAVRAADTLGASPEQPVLLQSIGEGHAGSVPLFRVEAGTCARTMTGAPVPEGADAMVMVEDVRVTPAGVEITRPCKPGSHIRCRGEDVTRGATVLRAGAALLPGEIAALAAMGRTRPLCHRRPRVAVISTGDEVVPAEATPGPGQIRDSNQHLLAAMATVAGAEVVFQGHVPDDFERICGLLNQLTSSASVQRPDAIVAAGGVSVGDRDFVRPAVEKLGSLELWRVRMKPGKPVAIGTIGNTLVFGLPGNPAGAYVAFELFVRPALQRMQGHRSVARPHITATLLEPIRRKPGRREYYRAQVLAEDGRLHARPLERQGSGMLTSMLNVNGLVIAEENAEVLNAGDSVSVLLLGPPA